MLGSDPTRSGVGTGDPILAPQQLWNYTTAGEPIGSSAAIANGVVYIGLNDGAFGNWGSYVDAFNATTGAVLWHYGKIYDLSSPAVVDDVVGGCGSPTIANNTVYVGCGGPGNTCA